MVGLRRRKTIEKRCSALSKATSSCTTCCIVSGIYFSPILLQRLSARMPTRISTATSHGRSLMVGPLQGC